MSDETHAEQPGGRMTRDDLVQRLKRLAEMADPEEEWQAEIGQTCAEAAAALAPQEAAPCIGRDPLCPCQDGDSCHYRDGTATDTKAWPIPAAPMPPIEVGDWVEDSIRIRAVLTDRDVEWWNSSEAAGTRLGVTEIRKANGTVWRRPRVTCHSHIV